MFVGFVLGLCFGVYFLMTIYSSAIILGREKEPIALLQLHFFLSCGCHCSVSLSHNAVGWYVVCDCGKSYSLAFSFIIYYRRGASWLNIKLGNLLV